MNRLKDPAKWLGKIVRESENTLDMNHLNILYCSFQSLIQKYGVMMVRGWFVGWQILVKSSIFS